MKIPTGRRGRPPFSAVGLALLLSAGCGGANSGEPPTVAVSGSLAVEGKPVSKGVIHFHPKAGRPATGYVKDGKFVLSTYGDGDGGIAGENRIAVEVTEEVKMPDGDTTSKSLIPAKFTDPDRSGLTYTIPEAGISNLEIDLVGTAAKIKP